MAVGGQDNSGARAGKGLWVLSLALVGAASGALSRYPLLTAASGLAFLLLFGVFLVVLGLPVLLAEAALGQFRRRNVVDTFGPGAWRPVGALLAIGAFLTAVMLAIVAGWFGRYAVDAFQGNFFDDPARHFRLFSAGWDALLSTLAVLAVATGVAMAGAQRGLRGTLLTTATVILVVLGGLALYGAVQSGAGAGRDDVFSLDLDAIDGALVVQAAQQALLPTLVGLGVVATSSSRVHDRTLPRDSTLLVLLLLLMPLAAGLFLVSLASANGQGFSGDEGLSAYFFAIPSLFASLGDTQAGVLSGLFYGSLLAASLVAVVALLEVPAYWLTESYEQWTPKRASLAVGLAAYLVALPFCFDNDAPHNLHLFLAGILVPVGGLLTALHVGWVRPEVLDGFQVGEAKHRLDVFLRPVLRFVIPLAMLFLLLIGLLGFLDAVGAIERGSAGLWPLVP